MEKDKLGKAADGFARGYSYDDETLKDCSFDSFVAGAEWLMEQPLSERLTEEEKKKIIKRYKDELEMAQYHTEKMKKSVNHTSIQFHANLREDYISRLKLLEKIFGKGMFEPQKTTRYESKQDI